MREQVLEALDVVRPYLQQDGGDIELVDIAEDGTVKVKLTGVCGGCPHAKMTLQNGVERIVKERVPEVKQVIADL